MLFILLLFFTACTSKLIVQSEPPEAEVFLSVEGKNNPVSAGKTPLELTETQLLDLLKITPESAQWIEFSFTKKDFETRTFLLPSNRWGELSRTLKIHLKPSKDSSTLVIRILRHLFNAKQFAETKQYDQAHAEVDKVIELDSQIPQAFVVKGGIFFLQNRLQDSNENYKKALAIDPSFKEAIQMMEKIKNKMGRGENP